MINKIVHSRAPDLGKHATYRMDPAARKARRRRKRHFHRAIGQLEGFLRHRLRLFSSMA